MPINAYLLLLAFLSLAYAQDAANNSYIEDLPISTVGSTLPTTTTSIRPKYARRTERQSAVPNLCWAPQQPANGVRRRHRDDCGDDILSCDLEEGVALKPGTLLNYTCNSEYELNGNPMVLCEGYGNWSKIPECIPIRCKSLSSPSRTAKCFRLGRWVACDSSVLRGTRAKLSCRPRFSELMTSIGTRSRIVECNKDAKWEPDPIECIPACGQRMKEGLAGSPWSASLFRQFGGKGRKYFKCGGTVIRNNLVLTAASCVYKRSTNTTINPKELFVIAGHFFQIWDHPTQDHDDVWKSVAKAIHIHCDYQKSHSVGDIALVEIEKPFQFSNYIIPACLEDDSYDEEFLHPGAMGSIVEFGMQAIITRPLSNVYPSTKNVLYVPFDQCKTSDKIFESEKESLTSDKFCTGYMNGSITCINDYGGGLTFERKDSWYVMGIVTRISDYIPTKNFYYSELYYGQKCEKYVIYTNVSQYSAWIQDVIFNLERYKSHPPCDLDESLNHVTTTTRTPILNDEGPSCLAPPQPDNGKWRSYQSFCQDEANCTILEGARLIPGTQLIYSCEPGYKAKGRTEVYCGFSGNWSAIPLCTEIKCDSLESVARKALCYNRFNKLVNGDSPVSPGTRVQISCHLGYRMETAFSTFRGETVICDENGKWTPDPIRCVPVCGVAVTHQKPFIYNGNSAKISDFPWHATLYTQENSRKGTSKQFICGATIIQTNFVLTAAHCVYDERTRTTVDPRKLYVMTGNILRDYDSPSHDPLTVKNTTVRNIHRPCKYYGLRGNYASDIALLELQTPFQFSSILLPACLDVQGYGDQILEPGVYGRVPGFGRTETGESSDQLQTLTLPYIAYNECKKSKNAEKNDILISEDKFCAGYANGSAVCEGDSGGGLVFQKRELWYVLGIVSVGLGVDLDNGEKTCDIYSFSLYTKVSQYMTWIQDVMFQRAQGNPYPPCDANV